MRILIVKLSSLGDIIHTLPLARHFKEDFVTWIAKPPFVSFLEKHPSIDRVIPYEGNFKFIRTLMDTEYDILFDPQGNCRSGVINRLVRAKRKVGYAKDCVPEWPNLLTTDEKVSVDLGDPIRQQILDLAGAKLSTLEEPFPLEEVHLDLPRPINLVCPGTAWPNKQLPFAQLVQLLGQLEGSIVFTWKGSQEKLYVEKLLTLFPTAKSFGNLSIIKWRSMMQIADKVICHDSAALALAATTPTPTLSFFGPSSSQVFKPQGDRHEFIQGKCPYNVSFIKRCPKLRTCKTGRCMNFDSWRMNGSSN